MTRKAASCGGSFRPARVNIGALAGVLNSRGYRVIKIGWRMYGAHRLAFLWMEGRWPMEEIDHANGDKTDNRWSNLREATQSQNTTNARTSIRNTSGYKGVSMDRSKPRQKKWRATIEVDGRTISLGYFDTPERAFIAYIFAAWDHFGDFARVR
jgi:HNH endonuclease/AP2 domain